jgi:hypothetical protein
VRGLRAEVARSVLRAFQAWAEARDNAELVSDGQPTLLHDLQCAAFVRVRDLLSSAIEPAGGPEPLFDAIQSEGATYDELEQLEGIYVDLAEDRQGYCRMCGCTDDRACAGGCSWVVYGLCSSCASWGWGALTA